MRKIFGAIITVILVGPSSFAADVYGVFMVVKGDVQVTNVQNVTAPAKVGSRINVGETVATGPDSRAKIVMSDRNVMNVLPDSKMKIEKYVNDPISGKKDVQLNLLEGKVRNNVEQTYDGEKNKFLVKTPTAVAGVRGTQFLTSYDSKSQTTAIVTLKGAVAFTTTGANGKSETVMVKKGEGSSASKGKGPEAPKALPKEDLKKVDSGSIAKQTPPPSTGGGADAGGKNSQANNNGSGPSPAPSRDPASAGPAPSANGGNAPPPPGQAPPPAAGAAPPPAAMPAPEMPAMGSAPSPTSSAGGTTGSAPGPIPNAPPPVSMVSPTDVDAGLAREIAAPAPAAPPPAAAAPPQVAAPPVNPAANIIRSQYGGNTSLTIRPHTP